MVKLSQVTLDTERQQSGVWVRLKLGFRALIASNDSPGFVQAVTEAQRLHPDNADAREDLIARAMARYLFLGWDELEDDQGAPIPYTFERALEYLTKPEYASVRDQVLAEACNRGNYYLKSAKAAGKD